MEILADVVQGSTLDEKEIEKQKTILLKELQASVKHLMTVHSTDIGVQDGHSPGKPGKVREFQSDQGKVRENGKSQGS